MNEIITSRQNPLIVKLSGLLDRKRRDKAGIFLLEGRKLFLEAIASGVNLEYVIVTEKYYEQYKSELLNYNIKVVSESVYDKISPEKAPEGIICAALYLDNLQKFTTIYNIDKNEKAFIAAGIQNPGNLGAIIRTCRAFGYDVLILDNSCADIYNIKTVRAAMGALFGQRIEICSDLTGTVDALSKAGKKVYSAALNRNAEKLPNLKIDSDTIFMVGNEGHGLSDELIEASFGSVFIPISENSESLNASLAAAILMYKQSEVFASL